MSILDLLRRRLTKPSTEEELVHALEIEAKLVDYSGPYSCSDNPLIRRSEESAFFNFISAMKSGGKYGPKTLQWVISQGDAIIDNLTTSFDDAILDRNAVLIAYIILALCDIGSPRSANTLISCFDKNFGTARIMRGEVFFSFELSGIYSHITSYLCDLQSKNKLPEDVLPRLRAFLENAYSVPANFNALPYVIDAVSILGGQKDFPLIANFLDYSCPEYDISEREIQDSARKAKNLLQEREATTWNNKGDAFYSLG